MSRYGWSLGGHQLSPYGTTLSSGAPNVTDEDYSYITSQDIDGNGGLYYPQAHSAAQPVPEDDILLIKHRGVTYPAHFPAYAIGDGKLRVVDVKERVGIMMDLSKRALRRMKLLYKGKQLKDSLAPVRDYGVKNNSELMAVLPEADDGSSPSEEEMVIVDAPSKEKKSKKKSKKKGGSKKSKKPDGGDASSFAASSPRDSLSAFESPRSPKSPPVPARPQTTSPVPPVAAGPLKQIADLDAEFTAKWQPLCEEYIKAPPADAKKRVDEHRKISETVLQQIILKTDSIDAEGKPEIRAKRRELVKKVQDVLKNLDVAKES